MENKFIKFQQYIRQNPVLVSVAVVAQIIFFCLIIFIAINAKTKTYIIPNLEVSNLKQDLHDLPDNSVEPIQTALYDIVSFNGGTFSSIESSNARIREGTITELYFEDINMHYVNVVIDIPDIEQSYQIFSEWSDNPNNPYFMTNMATMAMCPLGEQMIYGNFDCQDKFAHNGQRIIASEFLPHFNFDYFTSIASDDFSQIKISPINYDLDDTTKAQYIQEVKDAVTSLGISPNLFTYKVLQQSDLKYNIYSD